ncbi:MAG: phenylalanine--tRNA ligase subunit beta, partial [Candidatus Latescibacteria bacterium]|nr:phenylalanine--tRNA ligase subunit beta [Candidatus Latescibacterota bacterium]
MRVSYNWLKEYIDVPWNPDELSKRLTMAGHEAKSVESVEGTEDVVIDFEITPNRPDCLSMIGIAREVRVLTGGTLRFPSGTLEDRDGPEASHIVAVEVDDPAGCPRYSAGVITGVRVGSSPPWLRQRIEAAGFRPINSVVDITNYVMLETGQPLHAFDLCEIEGHLIVVRRGTPGECLVTLDGVERTVDPGMLLIADVRKGIALAGIMGGSRSEISEGTTSILIESAHFQPKLIREGVKRLRLSTEASSRFERGTDINVTVTALRRAMELIVRHCGGYPCRGVIDVYQGSPPLRRIRLRVDRLNALLGTSLETAQIIQILERLDCGVEPDMTSLTVIVPSFRPDLTREIDLIEEVARIHGYNEIPNRFVAMGPLGVEQHRGARVITMLKDLLLACGFSEVLTNSFVPPHHVMAGAITLSNPLSEDVACLRSSLLWGLLGVLRWNLHHGTQTVKIFEIGRVFTGGEGENPSAVSVSEELTIAGLATGFREFRAWDHQPSRIDFYDLKGVIEACLERLSDGKGRVELMTSSSHPLYDDRSSVSLSSGGESLGMLGQIRDEILQTCGIDTSPVFGFEFPMRVLLRVDRGGPPIFRQLPRYPAVTRDLAVVLDDNVPVAEVIGIIQAVDAELIEAVELFDVYRGTQVPSGEKSLTFSCVFRSKERTLLDE